MCSKQYLDHSNWSSHTEFPSWRRWNQPDGTLNRYSSSAFSKRRSWDPISHTFNGDTERPRNQTSNPYSRRSDSPYVSKNESAHDNKITSNPNSMRQKAITISNIGRYHENLHRLETQTPITLKQTNQPTSTLCEQSIKLKKALLIQLPTLQAKDTGNIVKSNPQNTEPVCQLNTLATLNDNLVEPQKITQIVRSDSQRTSKYTLVNTTGSTRVLLDPQHPMQYVLLKPVESGHTSHLKSQQTFPLIDSQFRAVNPVMQTDFQESMQFAVKFPQPSSQHLKTNIPVAEDIDGMIKQRPVPFFQRWPQESRDSGHLDTLNGIYQVHSEQTGTLHLNTTVMQRIPQVTRNISDCRVAASIPDSMVKHPGLSMQQSKKQDGGLKCISNSDVYPLESLNVKRYKYIEDESNFDHDEDPVVKTEEFIDESDQLDIDSAKKSLEYTTTSNDDNCTSRLNCSSIDKDMIRIKSKCKETKKYNSESDEGILLGTDILEKSLSDIVLVRSVGMSRVKNEKVNKMSNLIKEVKGKAKVAAFVDEGGRDKVDIISNKIEAQDYLGKVDIPLHTSTRKSTLESSRPIEVFQRCKEEFKLQEVVKNLSNTKDQTNVCKERKVVNNLSTTKEQVQTGESKDDVRTLNASVRPALESNRSAGSILKKMEEPDKRQKQQIDPIKPESKNDSEISSDMDVCVKGNAIDFDLAHSNFVSKIDAVRKLKQELTPSRNVLGAIELHDGSNVCLTDHKKSPAKIRQRRKIMCKSLKPKDTGSSNVVDRCPRGHFLKPLLATFNLQTGQITVPCRKCRSVIYMQSKVNSLL